MPFGIAHAPEEFQGRFNWALEGLDSVKTIIIYDEGDTDRRFLAFLERCRQRQIKLNNDKVKFKLPELTYADRVISAEGSERNPTKGKAILNMPPPTDKQGLRRFMGTDGKLLTDICTSSELTTPIQSLLKDDAEFLWEESVHGECFKHIKAVIASAPVLKLYNPSEEAVLQRHASQHGLGACLM